MKVCIGFMVGGNTVILVLNLMRRGRSPLSAVAMATPYYLLELAHGMHPSFSMWWASLYYIAMLFVDDLDLRRRLKNALSSVSDGITDVARAAFNREVAESA